MKTQLWVVRRERGGPWDWMRDMREQAGGSQNGMLKMKSIERWTILLDGRDSGRSN